MIGQNVESLTRWAYSLVSHSTHPLRLLASLPCALTQLMSPVVLWYTPSGRVTPCWGAWGGYKGKVGLKVCEN